MLIFPAIDLYEKKAVRLFKGDYDRMTVYSDDPVSVAVRFKEAGAAQIHMVDLEGARDGNTPNIDIVKRVVSETGLFVEIGGGIRSEEVIESYLSAGVGRVILGTAAVNDRALLERAAERYGDRLAVGADIKDGCIAVKGWMERSDRDAFEFCRDMEQLGIKTLICTDISRDGAMRGTNLELYRVLSNSLDMNIIASGGVSGIEDIRALKRLGMYGAIIGKAWYTGAVDLAEAIEEAAEV
ncbi:MAG: 1-(5-phosphoribosyl)-5-[(5-phosphoribosylamino)methylideneamino]imidazole-4-carboxamide isomerase [Eubacteriales bacterium]|nr:1-(5-phosphoribosyl)-5-[(5-phosphoribosylamino)methylideneamino]imidazole-4-carboxamide isomerase [Eubacteriales bacterium]